MGYGGGVYAGQKSLGLSVVGQVRSARRPPEFVIANWTPIGAYFVRIASVTTLPTSDSHVRPCPFPHWSARGMNFVEVSMVSRTRVKRIPLLRLSVTSTPFGRVETTWKSVWSPTTASTFETLSARSTSGPVGAVSVPAVAPRWPIATIVPMPCALSFAASAFTEAVEFSTWNGTRPAGLISVGRSSFEKPTIPILAPPKVSKTFDFDHSAGVFPFASTMFDETYANCASGISCVRRYCWPRSKLWLPRPSSPNPILFISSIVGLSPKKLEIGGGGSPGCPARLGREAI